MEEMIVAAHVEVELESWDFLGEIVEHGIGRRLRPDEALTRHETTV